MGMAVNVPIDWDSLKTGSLSEHQRTEGWRCAYAEAMLTMACDHEERVKTVHQYRLHQFDQLLIRQRIEDDMTRYQKENVCLACQREGKLCEPPSSETT